MLLTQPDDTHELCAALVGTRDRQKVVTGEPFPQCQTRGDEGEEEKEEKEEAHSRISRGLQGWLNRCG